MLVFWLIVTVLIGVSLAILVPPLMRAQTATGSDRTDANVELYQQRLRELEAEKSAGAIDADTFAAARQELDLNLLNDTETRDQQAVSETHRIPVAATVLLIPLVSVALYFMLGRVDILSNAPMPANGTPQMHTIEQMVNRLVTRLQENPGDGEGWVMLGRSYTALQRYADAEQAYAKAYALIGDHPDFLADYAEIIAMNSNNKLQGAPTRLLQLALKKNPKQIKALWLSGHAELQLGHKQQAVAYWKKLLTILPANDEAVATVRQYIAQVEGAPAPPATPVATTQLKVTVKIAAGVAAQARPDDTVFIFARAVSGPRMPLAIVRKQVRDLPLTVTLDDSMAMTPAMTLSKFDQVIIGARISRSGNALPQSGDLQGLSQPVPTRSAPPQAITINSVVP